MPDLGLEVLLKGKNMVRLLGGLGVALKISAVSVLLSLPLGILLGVLMTFKNPRDFSIPSVRLLGVVVSVIMDEPIISMVKRIAIKTAIRIPSLVTEIFHTENTTSPGVKNRLNTTVSISRKIMDFIPFIINLKGTLDNLITTARKKAAHTYPQILSKKNRDMINSTVPASFTRGSSLCIQESVW